MDNRTKRRWLNRAQCAIGWHHLQHGRFVESCIRCERLWPIGYHQRRWVPGFIRRRVIRLRSRDIAFLVATEGLSSLPRIQSSGEAPQERSRRG